MILHLSMYAYVRVSMYTSIYLCMQAYYICMYACMFTCVSMFMCVHVVYVHIIYVYRCIHVCSYLKILEVLKLDLNSWKMAGRLRAACGKHDFLSFKSFKMCLKTLKQMFMEV